MAKKKIKVEEKIRVKEEVDNTVNVFILIGSYMVIAFLFGIFSLYYFNITRSDFQTSETPVTLLFMFAGILFIFSEIIFILYPKDFLSTLDREYFDYSQFLLCNILIGLISLFSILIGIAGEVFKVYILDDINFNIDVILRIGIVLLCIGLFFAIKYLLYLVLKWRLKQ